MAEYKKYEEERNAASAQETQLQTEATVKNAIYQGVEGVLRAAKGTKNDVKDEFIASLEDNAYFNWVKNSDPDAADELLEYIKEQGKLPVCLTMSLAAYIAFYSNDIQELTDAGLICRRPAGNEYTVSDDRWVLEFYYEHRDAAASELVHEVLTNKKMWDKELTGIEGLEIAVTEDLEKIRREGAKAAYAGCL